MADENPKGGNSHQRAKNKARLVEALGEETGHASPVLPQDREPVVAAPVRGAVLHFLDELLLWRFSQIGIPILSGVIGATMVGIGHYDAAARSFALSGVWGVLSLIRAPLPNFDTRRKRKGVRTIGSIVIVVLTSWLVVSVLNAKPSPSVNEASLPALTLRSLMQGDLPDYDKSSQEIPIGNGVSVDCMVSSNLDSGAKVLSFFIPATPKTAEALLFLATKAQDIGRDVASSAKIKYKAINEPPQDSSSFPFTGKIYIYHEDYLSHAQEGEIETAFKQNKMDAILRGPDYLRTKQGERRIVAHVPLSVQHTHANWLTPHETPGYPLFPAYEGEVPKVGVGYRNSGDYPLDMPDSAVRIVLVERPDVPVSFSRFYDGLQHQGPAGTLPSGTDDFTYTTYDGPELSKTDAQRLNNGEIGLCAIGSLLWKDSSGEYETTLYQCALEQADHGYRWTVTVENNKERKLGYWWIYSRSLWDTVASCYKKVYEWLR
jgi:hypothetical protein